MKPYHLLLLTLCACQTPQSCPKCRDCPAAGATAEPIRHLRDVGNDPAALAAAMACQEACKRKKERCIERLCPANSRHILPEEGFARTPHAGTNCVSACSFMADDCTPACSYLGQDGPKGYRN